MWSEPLDFAGSTLSLWSLPLDFAGETLGPGTVTLEAPLAATGQRITAIPDLEAGDILEWSNVISPLIDGPTSYGGENYYNDVAYYGTQFVNTGDSYVIIYSNGSFEAAESVTSFDVRAYDTEWSAWVTQTVSPLIDATGTGAFELTLLADSSGTGVSDQEPFQQVTGAGVQAVAISAASSGTGQRTQFFGTDTHEYGTRLILVTGFDLSGNTELRIEVQRPDGTVVTYAGTIGAADDEVVDARGVTHQLQANEYLYRDWADGDIALHGRYRARAVYVDASRELRSLQVAFTVAP